MLRRTVARVATLEQAAGVGGVAVRELVGALRRAAGLAAADPSGAGEDGAGTAPECGPPPAWLDPARVVATLDAGAMLDAGQVPLPVVLKRARALALGEILRIDSTFHPVPLLEALAKQGCETHVREAAPGRWESFARRTP